MASAPALHGFSGALKPIWSLSSAEVAHGKGPVGQNRPARTAVRQPRPAISCCNDKGGRVEQADLRVHQELVSRRQALAGALLGATALATMPEQAQAIGLDQQMIVQSQQSSSLKEQSKEAPAVAEDAATPAPASSEEPASEVSPPAEPAPEPAPQSAPEPASKPAPAAKPAAKVQGAKFELQTDELNAYSYRYPVTIPSRGEDIPWVETRKPERYSSAAPISADARQRIVSARLDFKRNITCTVSVGPPNSLFLNGSDPNSWPARSVAESVLQDKSSSRMTPGQRQAESDIEAAKKVMIGGVPYFRYEYVQQKSPTNIERRIDTYRHNLAVTAQREGYLYTLNLSAPELYWKDVEPIFREAVESFTLEPPTKEYVPPYKDPWRFW